MHGYYHDCARNFTHNIVDIAQEHFGIAMWFTFLNFIEIRKLNNEFNWFRDENFIFIWGLQQCIHTKYFSNTYDCIGGVQHVYKKMFNGVLIKYREIYETSNILSINEGQYHARDNNEENCLIVPLIWRFDGLFKKDKKVKNILCSLLNHLEPR